MWCAYSDFKSHLVPMTCLVNNIFVVLPEVSILIILALAITMKLYQGNICYEFSLFHKMRKGG